MSDDNSNLEDLLHIFDNLSITSTDSPNQSNFQNNSILLNNQRKKYKNMSDFKTEYLNCVPQFDGNPNELYRYLNICEGFIKKFYKQNDPTCFENIYLINCLISKLSGNAKIIVSIQNCDTWDCLKATLTRNFADQRDETCLNRDLVMLRQQPNEKAYQFYDNVLHLLNLLCSYIDIHELTEPAKLLKRTLYNDLALKTFLAGLREPLGTTIRCMRPKDLNEALQLVIQEDNIHYFQNLTNKNANYRQPVQNFKPQTPQNHRQPFNVPFNAQTQNNFFRARESFPSQPVNVQPRPNYQPQRFPTNSEVFGAKTNVFKPTNKPQPRPTPMSVSTRRTFTPNFNRNFNRPGPSNYQNKNQIQVGPPQQKWTAEELYNTETNQNTSQYYYDENPYDQYDQYGNFESHYNQGAAQNESEVSDQNLQFDNPFASDNAYPCENFHEPPPTEPET